MRIPRLILLTCFCLVVFLLRSHSSGQPPEDDREPSEELREMLAERAEFASVLESLAAEQREVEQRSKMLDELIEVRKRLDALIARREIVTDESEAESLDEQIHGLEVAIEETRAKSELAIEQDELKRLLRRLKAAGAMEFAPPIQALSDAIVELSRLDLQRDAAERDENDEEFEELTEKIKAVEPIVEYGWEHVDLVRDLGDAHRRGDKEAVEELISEIESLATAYGFGDEGEKESGQPSAVTDPTRLPIPVTPETLASIADVNFESDVVPLLRTYCFECHNSDAQSGELDLERLLSEKPIVKNRGKWINVIEQTKNRVMPPEDAVQPSEESRRVMVLASHRTIYDFDYSNIHNPGYEQTRRLTHEEYDNTIRDLVGIDLKPTQKFPADLSGSSGFDNSANTLFIQPTLMERYIGAAESVIAAALPVKVQSDGERRKDLARARALLIGAYDLETQSSEIISRFLTRAYRRPVTAEELSRAQTQFTTAKRRGLSSFKAIKLVFQTALVSPNFLLRNEQTQHDSEPFQVTDWELASRLSYFLWGSMPDEDLFALAKRDELSESLTLHAQVDRMIADDRSKTLGSVFAAQWLGSVNLGTRMRLDPIDNPWCTESLMAAMRDETAMFFHSLVQDNESIERLINAEYTFLNEELATLYEIEGISGEQMRRVELAKDQRGGILGQGSLLAVTSFPYRTSPVVRGHWILDTLLGTPPPPPPPNVSEFDEDLEENERLSFRQKLERHRRDPNCYACHSQMDPLGFSLEGYDWFGRKREPRRRGRQRDTRGRLPNGTEFEGLAGLKQVIVNERMDDLCRQVSTKMLSYALGRQLEYYDEPAIRKIIAAVEQDGYRFQTLIHQIVESYPFQNKQRQLRVPHLPANQKKDSQKTKPAP